MQKHFGDTSDYYCNHSVNNIEVFLKDWFNKDNLKIIFIMEYCNVFNGYPYWRFECKI